MIRTVQNSFVSGEIDPALHGRHDLKAYYSGAALIDNLIVRKAGGLRKRQGTDIIADLSDYPGCRVIPFFFDRTNCSLIVLHSQTARFLDQQPDGTFAFARAADDEIYALAGMPWADADLASVRFSQLGDTVFLTAPGYQAAKLIRYSPASWKLTLMTGLVTVPAPPALTAMASSFEEGSGYVAYSANYALYSIKNGIISTTPAKRKVAITLPWASGAKVKLSWTPDLESGVDGYLLGKKQGAYYGLLLDARPTREPLSLTGKTFTTSGAGTDTTHHLVTDHATSLRAEDPNALADNELKLSHSQWAISIPRPADGSDPWLKISFVTAKAIGKIRLYLGAFTADHTGQNLVTVDYSAPLSVRFSRYTGTAYTAEETFDVQQTDPATGYVEITIADTNSSTNSRYLHFTSLAPQETAVILRGVALYDRSGTPALITSWTAARARTQDNFTARGVSGIVTLATNYSITHLDITANPEDRDNRTDRSCSPKRYLQTHATPMALAVAADSGSYYATVTLAHSDTPFRVTEFRLYLGARSALLPFNTPGTAVEIPSNTLNATVQYSNNGSSFSDAEVSAAPVTVSIPSQYSAEPVSIIVPDDDTLVAATANAIAWRLKIKAAANAPVYIRGLVCHETTIASEFIDENHAPTTLIDTQTYIHPGSSDMDVDVISHYQQRLVLASSYGMPFTIWFSKLGDITMWYASTPLDDTDPFSGSIPAVQASRILHAMSDKRLMLFTESGLYIVEGSDSEGFAYRTCRIYRAANIGACDVPPVTAGAAAVLFVANDARTIHELKYDFASDTVIPIDRSVLAGHLTEASPIIAAAWAASPDSCLWAVLADGTLLSFTFMPEHEVFAWSRHTLPAGLTPTDVITPGSILNAASCEPATQTFLLADLAISSDTSRKLLLRLRPPPAADTLPASAAAALDLAQTLVRPRGALASWTPAVPYPEGASVTALFIGHTSATILKESLETDEPDYAPITLVASADGSLSPIPDPGVYLLGIPVDAELQTLRPELPDRPVQGLRKRAVRVLVRARRAVDLTVGPVPPSDAPRDDTGTLATLASLAQSPAPNPSAAADALAATGIQTLITRDLIITPSGHWNRDCRLRVKSAGPWPAEILSVTTDLETE